jgi:hypothetical protein
VATTDVSESTTGAVNPEFVDTRTWYDVAPETALHPNVTVEGFPPALFAGDESVGIPKEPARVVKLEVAENGPDPTAFFALTRQL